jgi:hypothetical protein
MVKGLLMLPTLGVVGWGLYWMSMRILTWIAN